MLQLLNTFILVGVFIFLSYVLFHSSKKVRGNSLYDKKVIELEEIVKYLENDMNNER